MITTSFQYLPKYEKTLLYRLLFLLKYRFTTADYNTAVRKNPIVRESSIL